MEQPFVRTRYRPQLHHIHGYITTSLPQKVRYYRIYIKGALCSFGEEIHICEVTTITLILISIITWRNKLFSEEKKVPRSLLEARKLAGSATYEPSKTVRNFGVLFVSSVMETVCLFSLFLHKNSMVIQSKQVISLLIKMSASKLQNAPLNLKVPNCIMILGTFFFFFFARILYRSMCRNHGGVSMCNVH